ncbi:hypothetical protein [Comamonas sp. NLF-1-9]|uniref:hypothetical protein n=1 Tax=Comamonas sp. NLF-1-9 TaxID=2853163 RepID=UPI001C4740E0|nr:hypothetical protein [Comamonas sp. NLF-1-9]QXL83216.1 hypothetical protein KUD94_08000 [Comamonas sp. NLF-1-9]
MTPRMHGSRPRFPRWLGALVLPLWLVSCGGGDGGGGGGGEGHDVSSVAIQGRVSYDFVPATISAGLNYANITSRPARGVQVVAVADDGRELASTRAGADGSFTLTVPVKTSVRLRAKARLLQAPGAGASWDFSVRDNTSAGYAQGNAALYTVQSEAFDSGSSATLARDLHAGSGWTGSGYGQARAAAPFAILDQFYSAIEKIRAVDPGVAFPAMNAYWSINNRPANGDPSLGEITTSHWRSAGATPGLYILGKADVDTDEYDTGVIVHEWGHYFESRLSRSDSTGGPHGGGEVLDMRLAFGEAWGNALAGMVRDDPLYIDTNGPRQARSGLAFDLGLFSADEPAGWFNEAAVQTLLYKTYRAPQLGFDAIYRVMTGPQKSTPAFTSLFTFATYLRAGADADGQAVLDGLLADIQTVHGAPLDIWGTHQAWPQSLASVPEHESKVLPIYTSLTLGAQPARLCATDELGVEGNKLGNRRYYRFAVASSAAYKLEFTEGDASVVEVRGSGGEVALQEIDDQTVGLNLTPGEYVMAILPKPIKSCFSVRVFQ